MRLIVPSRCRNSRKSCDIGRHAFPIAGRWHRRSSFDRPGWIFSAVWRSSSWRLLIYGRARLILLKIKRARVICSDFLWSARARADDIIPLARIDWHSGKDPSDRQEIGCVIYEAMVPVEGLRADAGFQVVSEQDADNFLSEPGYRGVDRSDDPVVIQITWNEGRTAGQKALSKAITEGLETASGIPRG